MKCNSLICIFLLYFVLCNVAADEEKFSYKEMMSTLEALGESCEKKPTKENIRQILSNTVIVDTDTKCFRRCLMELFDLQVAGSTQMNEETASELSEIMYPHRKVEFREFLKKCNEENAHIEDECEAAHAHFVCLINELETHGFEIPVLKEEEELESDAI